jgi:acyl-CoA synthetase (NDP forming)
MRVSQAFTRLQQARVPTFCSLPVAARWLRRSLRPRRAVSLPPSVDPAALDELATEIDTTYEVATEAELTPLLQRAGIPMAASRFVRNSLAVAEAVDSFGGPVAVKVISPRLLHRNAVGGVVLNLTDRAEAAVAADALLSAHPIDTPRDGLLVQGMVDITGEYFVGLHRDEHFGLLLLFGRGGVNVEQNGEVLVRRWPVPPSEIAAMGAEVDPDAPIAAITEAVFRLAELGVAFGDRLTSLEINPLVVPAHDRQTVLGIDALATFSTPTPDSLAVADKESEDSYV